jgi:hypothetical protein
MAEQMAMSSADKVATFSDLSKNVDKPRRNQFATTPGADDVLDKRDTTV